MHNIPDMLGNVIKQARQRADITIEDLAEKVGVTDRYIYRIENEGKKPSYQVLFKLIHVLSINPEQIFYPEKPAIESEVDNLVRMLYDCDERSLEVITATAKALISTSKVE